MKIPDPDDHTKEMLILVFIFVFGSAMLAAFPGKEELARWIENGAIVAILARAFGSKSPSESKDPNAKSTTVSTTVEQTKKETP